MDTVYIIEDDRALCDELGRLLRLQGYAVESCDDFDDVAGQVLRCAPDCVVLDLMLPGANGHELCRDIRKSSQVPIIMLTSSTAEFDEVMALGLGADDYVTKPYRPAVLLARIQAALRSGGKEGQAKREYGGVTLDEGRARASAAAGEVELTRNEMRILRMLMQASGRIVSRQDIMCELWESDEFIDDNTLTVNVNRLRRALASIGAPSDFIKTHRGIGYSL